MTIWNQIKNGFNKAVYGELTKEDYWEAHIQLFIKLLQAYKRKPVVVIEDYILYASTAEAARSSVSKKIA